MITTITTFWFRQDAVDFVAEESAAYADRGGLEIHKAGDTFQVVLVS